MAVGRPAWRRRRVSAETSPSMPRAARPAGTVCSTRRSRRCRGEYAPAVAGFLRGGVHAGVRDGEIGAAKTVEAEVDRALTGGVGAGEESESGMERGYQTADDPQPCPRCRGQQHQVVPVGQCRVVVGDREPDGDTTVARREQTGAARLPHEAAKFDVQEEQIAAAGDPDPRSGTWTAELVRPAGTGEPPTGRRVVVPSMPRPGR